MTWRVIQNSKNNWVVVWKMTWEIWQILARAPESVKIGTLMGCFYPKQKIHELKIYKGVTCHDNEKWLNIWKGIDLSVKNWHEEFDKFWPEHLKI